MSLMDSLKNTLSETLTSSLNRYHLAIPSCTSALDVEEFSGREFMSEIYLYTIRFTSTDNDIPAEQILHKSATMTMGTGPLDAIAGLKVVHGTVTHFQRISGSADQSIYQIIIEPFLALLDKQFRTHRFFVNKSVPEVVQQVLSEHGLKSWEFDFRIKKTYPKREQINQYQESDLTFIQRLLAEVGIFYYFTLQPDTQTEVIHFGDSQATLMGDKKLVLNSPSGTNDNGAEAIWGLRLANQVVESNVITKDYNHREAQNLIQSAPADMTRGEGDGINYGSVYHYRLRHTESGDKIDPVPETANFWARLDHERFLAKRTIITAISSDATLSPAQVLSITESEPPTLPTLLKASPVLITQLVFTANRSEALKVLITGVPYSETVCWRPDLLPRPKVTGTMTARVTSAKANDIYAWQDAGGLYHVKFDADLDDKHQGKESMPVRFAKPYGGDKYGFHFPLIQGTEVAIAFHEGDPDRPYIAHALHDSRHVDHVTEANSTRNVIRTAGLNKLRMEDKRGEEHVKLSTEYGGKTQLNLGHNVDACRKLRGEGAELRTDRHVSIRGGAGVFITADKQSFAGDKMLSMKEAISQLDNALTIAKSLSSAAEGAEALPADTASQLALNAALKELAKPGIMLNAPDGVSITSPQAVRVASGTASVGIMSQQNTDISALKRFTVAAGEAVSMLARKAGMKLFAAKGKVEIQAQNDALETLAKKDIIITSTEGGVEITAAKDVVLKNLDGSFIQLQGKNMIIGCAGNILLKCTNIQKMGSTVMNTSVPQLPSEYSGKYTISSNSGVPMTAAGYVITASNGQKFFGKTDEKGETLPVYSSNPNEQLELEMIRNNYWYDSEDIVERMHYPTFIEIPLISDSCDCEDSSVDKNG